MNNIKKQVGSSPFVAIMIICAAVLIIAASLANTTHIEMEVGLSEASGLGVLNLTNSCAEEALQRLRNNSEYTTSSSTLLIGEGLCILSVSSTPIEKNIQIIGRLEDYYRQVSICASTSPEEITILEWLNY